MCHIPKDWTRWRLGGSGSKRILPKHGVTGLRQTIPRKGGKGHRPLPAKDLKGRGGPTKKNGRWSRKRKGRQGEAAIGQAKGLWRSTGAGKKKKKKKKKKKQKKEGIHRFRKKEEQRSRPLSQGGRISRNSSALGGKRGYIGKQSWWGKERKPSAQVTRA